MTEHCANNRTSICQTEDATHLVVKYRDFISFNNIGGTYSSMGLELLFHFTTDFESYDDRRILCVTSISDRTWHVIVYDDPYDNNSNGTLKVLLAKETLELYTVRDFEFNKHDELLIFFRIGEENIQLLEQVIEEEEMVRLYNCLKSLYEDYEFSDMTVQGKWPAHRAVVAAACKVLDEAVLNLPFNKSGMRDCIATTSTDLVPTTTTVKNIVHSENVKTELQSLSSKILDNATEHSNTTTDLVSEKNEAVPESVKEQVSNLPLNKSSSQDSDATSTDFVPAKTEKNKTDPENSKELEFELQSLTNKSFHEGIPILPLTKCSDATSSAEERETKTQRLASAILAFANSLNINIKNKDRLIRDLQDNLEEDVSTDDEIHFNKPESTNYMLDFRGLTSSDAKELLSYIYTGDLCVSSVDDGEGDILNLFVTVNSYKIESLLNLLEKKCIDWIRHHNVATFLRYSQLFKLEKLRLNAIKFIRGLLFHNVANSEQDPFVHKCILSTPTHKFKTYGTFTFTVPNISELKEHSAIFFLCNKRFDVCLRKHVKDDVCYLDAFIFFRQIRKRWAGVLNFDFAIFKDKHRLSYHQSVPGHIFTRHDKGWGWPQFISWKDLMNPDNGYVENDAITVKVFVDVLDCGTNK